jgi:hypothetical protein
MSDNTQSRTKLEKKMEEKPLKIITTKEIEEQLYERNEIK